MKITKLDTPLYVGDWHDPPLKWRVQGPGDEVQHFSTKRNAQAYKRIRSECSDIQEAFDRFVRET